MKAPVEPLRHWLSEQPYTLAELAEWMGVDERQIRRWLNESTNVDLDVLDVALARAGVHLSVVYPELERPTPNLDPMRIFLSPELLVEAKRGYDAGASIVEMAEELWEESGYRSIESLREALYQEFRNQGWEIRSFTESSRLGALRSKGRKCEREDCRGFALRDGLFCINHEPSRREANLKTLQRAWAGQGKTGVPIRPFSEWLNEKIAEEGSCRAFSRKIGVNDTQIHRYACGYRWFRGEKKSLKWEEERVVRQVLEAEGSTTLEELYA